MKNVVVETKESSRFLLHTEKRLSSSKKQTKRRIYAGENICVFVDKGIEYETSWLNPPGKVDRRIK